ncbi:MAG: hypothetical protein HZB55_11155 [Deltaproteobacteria bacterium]|nr:hypothetical protein [Deltaproteobacteria bacterium]
MKPGDVTLFSGGARGAEAAFGAVAEAHGVAQVNYTFLGHEVVRSSDSVSLSDEELARGDVSMAEVSRRLHRDYSTRPWMRRILQSIWHQVNSGHQVFVVGEILGNATVKGGTGWAVELGKVYSRPLSVFDPVCSAWFAWRDGAWVEDVPRIDHPTVCGTGTRDLNEAGRRAIQDLFARSFGA